MEGLVLQERDSMCLYKKPSVLLPFDFSAQDLAFSPYSVWLSSVTFADAQGYKAMGNKFTMGNFPWGEKLLSQIKTLMFLLRLEAPEFVFLLASTFFVMKHPRKE